MRVMDQVFQVLLPKQELDKALADALEAGRTYRVIEKTLPTLLDVPMVRIQGL
jgi:hypothetical protein